MFGLGEGYAVAKVTITKNNPFSDKPIKSLKSHLEDILILCIYRKVDRKIQFIGAPHGDVILKAGDELICYAKEEIISKSLFKHRS